MKFVIFFQALYSLFTYTFFLTSAPPPPEEKGPFLPEFVEKLIFSETPDEEMVHVFQIGPISHLDKIYYDKNLYLTCQQSRRLCELTIDQWKNETWKRERDIRITPTKGHRFLKDLENNADDEVFIKHFLPGKILDKDKHPALKYGCDNEHLAKAGYIAYKGHTVPFTVFDVGSISKHRFSWFSGSLDGLIWRENQQEVGVLEIKCIYSCRNKRKIENKDCAFLLNKDGKLSENHPYWLQIQLYAWLTHATFAHLWLWTANDQRLINVPLKPDEA